MVTPEYLAEMNTSLKEAVDMWINELITDVEFSSYVGEVAAKLRTVKLVGMIDPNTGLRYS